MSCAKNIFFLLFHLAEYQLFINAKTLVFYFTRVTAPINAKCELRSETIFQNI
jgi:hypothetical protein